MVFQVEQCMFQVEHVSLAKGANGFLVRYLSVSTYMSPIISLSRWSVAEINRVPLTLF